MAIIIGKGAGGGGGSSSGFKLGPLPNTFRETGIDSKAAAEAARDAFAADPANAAWLAEYDANPTITIALEYRDAAGNEVASMQLRDEDGITPGTHIWYDSETFKGLRGIAGATGLSSVLLFVKNTDPTTAPARPTGTTVPPAGGWTTGMPALAAGEYMWSTVTYMEDTTGTTCNGFWSTPSRMTGEDGVDATNDTFIIVADPAARLAIPVANCQVGTRVVQQDTGVMYINITGGNGAAADWQKANSFDRTYTGDVVMDGDLRYDNDEVHLGRNSGVTNQGSRSVAVGRLAANADQGDRSVAVGVSAAQVNQGTSSVAVGDNAGENNQGDNAVAVGKNAGQTSQGMEGVALGDSAGMTNQGVRAVAIGVDAGVNNQPDRSIIINANNTALNKTNEGAFGLHTGGTNQLEIDYDAGVGDNLKINKTVEATGYIGDGIVPTPPAGGKVLTSNGTGSGDYIWADPTGGGGGGIVDAPIDGNLYGRKDGNWANIDDADHTWTGNNSFNRDVTTLGKFIGVGAIDAVDQTAGRVLTANSATEGDYTWADLPAAIAAESNYRIVADMAARDAIPNGERKEGMAVFVQADDIGYVLIGGISNADWKRQSPVLIAVNDIAERNAIPTGWRFEGLHVYVIGEDTTYRLLGALTNDGWKIESNANLLIVANAAERLALNADVLRIGTHAYQLDDMEMYINTTATNVGGEINWQKFNDLDITYGGDVAFTGAVTSTQNIEVTGTGKFVGTGAVPDATEDNKVLTSHADGSTTWEDAAGGFDVTADYTVTGDWQFQGDVRSSSNEVHLGNSAGLTAQGANSVAVGTNAGNNTQGTNSVAVGNRAGRVNQGNSAVAVGLDAGNSGQGEDSVAIGHNAGSADQGDNSIIISSKGTDVNNTNDGSLQIETDVVTIRHDGDAGGNLRINQVIEPQGLLTNGGVQVTGTGSFVGTGSVPSAGMATGHILTANSGVAGDYEWKASSAVAVAGANFFLANDLAGRMGIAAADLNVGAFCIQIDTQRMYVNLTGNNGDPNVDWKDWGEFDHTFTGEFRLESDEVHLGKDAGMTTPGTDSVAVGRQAGQTNLGDYAVALGFLAGALNQGENSIVINSSANNVSNTHANSLTINTGELQMNFNGATNDHLTINKEIDVTDITITTPRLITGVPI